MMVIQKSINDKLQETLDKRIEASLYRSLQVNEGLIDFCSNDYLSFARSEKIKSAIFEKLEKIEFLLGSTGSRSISGNTSFTENLEKKIAAFHQMEAGLIFNSGYDANLGLFSCIASKEDTLICDELIHASIIDGCRLSHAKRYKFAHNDVFDLEKKLQKFDGNVFVAIESVYSMDGDCSPLLEISELCERYKANLIVDEAHATGVFGKNGKGLVNHFGLQDKVFARIHTFGKAMGCHGAIVLGSELLRNYLINFARSFIFTTALPLQSLVNIECAYESLTEKAFEVDSLFHVIKKFQETLIINNGAYLIKGNSPIQSLVIGGNEKTRSISKKLQEQGFDVRAILSPSVPSGKERLRISLHLHNTEEQVVSLANALNELLVL